MTIQSKSYELAGSLPVAINARWAERVLLLIGLLIVDTLMVLMGFWLAYLIRFEADASWWFYNPETLPIDLYRQVTFVLVPIWLFVFASFGLYQFKHLFNGMREYALVFNSCPLGMMLLILYVAIVYLTVMLLKIFLSLQKWNVSVKLPQKNIDQMKGMVGQKCAVFFCEHSKGVYLPNYREK